MSDLPEVVMPSCDTPKLLKGQKALVTGSSSGIGKAVAMALGAAGADEPFVDGGMCLYPGFATGG